MLGSVVAATGARGLVAHKLTGVCGSRVSSTRRPRRACKRPLQQLRGRGPRPSRSLAEEVAQQAVAQEATRVWDVLQGLAAYLAWARADVDSQVRAHLSRPAPAPAGWEGAPPDVMEYFIAMTGGSTEHAPDPEVEALWRDISTRRPQSLEMPLPTSLWGLRAAAAAARALAVSGLPQDPGGYPASAFASEALRRWHRFQEAARSGWPPAFGGSLGAPASFPGAEGVEVYATHLTNDEYVVGASVLAASLAASGTARPLVALVSDAVSAGARRALRHAGWELLDITLPGIAGVDTFHSRSFVSKIWLWALPADTVIYLDTDVLVLQNIDELFVSLRRTGTSMAAVPDSQPHLAGELMVQGGLIVLEPSPRRFADLWDWCTGDQRPKGLDEWSWHDQELLTAFFNATGYAWAELPAKYNFCLRYHLRPLYAGLAPASAAVLHYATAKPWDPEKRHHVLPPYVKLYLQFARQVGVPWQPVVVSSDTARDEEDEHKLAGMVGNGRAD